MHSCLLGSTPARNEDARFLAWARSFTKGRPPEVGVIAVEACLDRRTMGDEMAKRRKPRVTDWRDVLSIEELMRRWPKPEVPAQGPSDGLIADYEGFCWILDNLCQRDKETKEEYAARLEELLGERVRRNQQRH